MVTREKSAAAEQIKQGGSIMWVYQQTGTPAHLPEAAQPLPTGEAALLPQPQKTLPPERSAPEVPSPLQRHHTETRQKTCWLLVCAFLIGSGSAGVLLAFCESSSRTGCNITCKAGAACLPLQIHILRPAFRNGISYAGCGRDPSVPDGLFRTGAGFDLLFTMFYGLGNGTLFVQLLSDTALKRKRGFCCLHFCLRQLLLQGCARSAQILCG